MGVLLVQVLYYGRYSNREGDLHVITVLAGGGGSAMLRLLRARAPRAALAARGVRCASFGAGQRLLQVIDCHAEGEPARVVVGGMPHIAGADMIEKRQT